MMISKRPLKQVAIWHDVDKSIFEEQIQPLAEPAILKGFVKSWPLISENKTHNKQALLSALQQLYIGGDVQYALLDKTSANGRYFYNSQFNGFNFERKIASFDRFTKQLLEIGTHSSQAVAIQSAPVRDYFPAFEQSNKLGLFNENVAPRFWLGNSSTVVPHYDDADNIACSVFGKRRFTLFPPEQISNLYVGPLNFTPAGAPVSLVDVEKPDFTKYPKFKTALNHALVAQLAPGDALYIPSLWWHNVESLDEVNMLVNYWQGGSIANNDKPVPMDSLLLSLMTIKTLPKAKRQAWQAFFNHYIFESHPQDSSHIPSHIQGILGQLNDTQKKQISQWLISQLSK